MDGTLRTLGLPGSDLRFAASLADLARLAAVFDVRGLPAGALELGGHVVSTRTEIKLDGFDARYAGVRAKADGAIGLARGKGIDMRFEVAAASLAKLQPGLPDIPLLVNGNYVARRGRLEVKQIKGRIGENAFTGEVALVEIGKPRGKPRIEVELAAPRLDLAQFTADKKGDGAQAKPPAADGTPAKYVFDEAPLPFAKLKEADAKVHVAFADVRPGVGTFRDADATLGSKMAAWRSMPVQRAGRGHGQRPARARSPRRTVRRARSQGNCDAPARRLGVGGIGQRKSRRRAPK